MWIARDKYGNLYAYLNKPIRFEEVFGERDTLEEAKTVVYMKLPQDDFKDVTWENSPREITCCPSMIDKLNYHLDTTLKEELDKEFKELESFNNIGPTVEEYLGGVNYNDIKINAAIYVMGSIISGNKELPDAEIVADKAIEYANALIKKLKK